MRLRELEVIDMQDRSKMELGINHAHFSQWVQTSSESELFGEESQTSEAPRQNSRSLDVSNGNDTPSNKVYTSKVRHAEDLFKEAVQKWIEHPEKKETNRLKKFVRQGVQPQLRCELWEDTSGGADIILNAPHYYKEVMDEMGE